MDVKYRQLTASIQNESHNPGEQKPSIMSCNEYLRISPLHIWNETHFWLANNSDIAVFICRDGLQKWTLYLKGSSGKTVCSVCCKNRQVKHIQKLRHFPWPSSIWWSKRQCPSPNYPELFTVKVPERNIVNVWDESHTSKLFTSVHSQQLSCTHERQHNTKVVE